MTTVQSSSSSVMFKTFSWSGRSTWSCTVSVIRPYFGLPPGLGGSPFAESQPHISTTPPAAVATPLLSSKFERPRNDVGAAVRNLFFFFLFSSFHCRDVKKMLRLTLHPFFLVRIGLIYNSILPIFTTSRSALFHPLLVCVFERCAD